MKLLRIGTRKSELAIWQAQAVHKQLKKLGLESTLVPISSEGDLNLTQPLYAMGIEGVFTKALDTALLNNQIDLAVHSLKDMPTQMADGICQAAVLPRENPLDVVVFHPHFKDWTVNPNIGTGSLRRKAQWLRKFSTHKVENLRGNLQKRIEKLNKSDWGGALFAAAGIKRMGWKLPYQALNWMIPAPGQGAIAICCKSQETALIKQLEVLNCTQTMLCTSIERKFLQILEGGCTAPIGALARVEKNQIHFKAGLFSLDGHQAFEYENTFNDHIALKFAEQAAEQIKKRGGDQLIDSIKKTLK